MSLQWVQHSFMQPSPGLADLLLAELPSLDKFDGRLAVVLAVGLMVFVLPHWVAARALAPEPTTGRVVATAFTQLALVLVAIAAQGYALSIFGSSGATLAGIVLVLIFALVTAAIYEFGFVRGLAYNAIVAALVLSAGWVADRMFYREEGGLVAHIWGPSQAPADTPKTTAAPGMTPQLAAKSPSVAAGTPAGTSLKSSSLPKLLPPVTPRYATVQDAQAAAIVRYPDLAKASSPFNQRFLEKHAAYKAKHDPILDSPDWPMKIATEVAGDLAAR